MKFLFILILLNFGATFAKTNAVDNIFPLNFLLNTEQNETLNWSYEENKFVEVEKNRLIMQRIAPFASMSARMVKRFANNNYHIPPASVSSRKVSFFTIPDEINGSRTYKLLFQRHI